MLSPWTSTFLSAAGTCNRNSLTGAFWMSYRTSVLPLTSVSPTVTQFTISARVQGSTISVATCNFHDGCRAAASVGISLKANIPGAASPRRGVKPTTVAAGTSDNPSNDSVLTCTPTSDDTVPKPASFAIPSGCQASTATSCGC